MLFKLRFKYLDDYSTVKLHASELQRFKVDSNVLRQLVTKGEIWYDTDWNFKALKAGAVDLTLLKKRKSVLTPLHEWMREQLKYIELPISEPMPPYFQTFLNYRAINLDLFATVDSFCGRFHSPVTSLDRGLRPMLRLYGDDVVEIDLVQAQPSLLGCILTANVGVNDFSSSIENGTDIYCLLQEKAGLKTRDDAKKLLFKILFGYPSDDLQRIFGDADWIRWINAYKSRVEPRNPHKAEPHTNLAWLLQSSEVQIFTEIWTELARNGIPFVSVHDSVICRKSDQEKVITIFNNQLSKQFNNFKITTK
jgi:hypothetical protein